MLSASLLSLFFQDRALDVVAQVLVEIWPLLLTLIFLKLTELVIVTLLGRPRLGISSNAPHNHFAHRLLFRCFMRL